MQAYVPLSLLSSKLCAVFFIALNLTVLSTELGLPWWLRCYRRLGFDPRVGKSPWRRQRQPTPVLLPGEFHGRRSLVGYNPWGCRVGHDWATNTITTCWVHTSELTHVNPIRCILASPSTYKQGNWDTKRLNKLPMGTKLATGSMENQSSEAPGPHLWKKNIACHSSSGEGNGTPLQYSCLANPMDGGA